MESITFFYVESAMDSIDCRCDSQNLPVGAVVVGHYRLAEDGDIVGTHRLPYLSEADAVIAEAYVSSWLSHLSGATYPYPSGYGSKRSMW